MMVPRFVIDRGVLNLTDSGSKWSPNPAVERRREHSTVISFDSDQNASLFMREHESL